MIFNLNVSSDIKVKSKIKTKLMSKPYIHLKVNLCLLAILIDKNV